MEKKTENCDTCVAMEMQDLKVTDVRCNPGDSAFLIDDGKTAILYDTGYGFTGHAVAQNLRKVLGSRRLDYIFLTHSHYDHALGCPYILRSYPEAKIIAHEYAAYIFKRESALKTMKFLDSRIAELNGVTDYEFLGNEFRVDVTVRDKDVIQAGDLTFEVIGLPGHTRDSIAFYCRDLKLLLSTETLGVYDGKTSISPSFLIGFDLSMKSIDKALSLDVENLLVPHYGLLSPEQRLFFLKNMRKANLEAVGFIMDRIRSGETTENIIEAFKAKYRNEYTKTIYPVDAINLNTSIMIELLRKENPTFC